MQGSEECDFSPPRTHGTPSGYRNIRVLVTRDLHFRLLSHASQSHLSLPAFVVAWLNLATPLDSTRSPQGQPTSKGSAPGHRPGLDTPVGHGNTAGPGAAQPRGEPAWGQRPARAPVGLPCEADGPSAAPPSAAPAQSSPDRTEDLTLSGSLPTGDPDPSSSDHRPD